MWVLNNTVFMNKRMLLLATCRFKKKLMGTRKN